MRAARFGRVALALAATAIAAPAAAAPFDFIQVTYEAATGVWLTYGPVEERRDGLPITSPVSDYIARKEYTAEVLQFGSGAVNESYAQFDPQEPWRGFGSAQAGTSTLDVGVESRNGAYSNGTAMARARLTIKNNFEDRSLDLLEFAFAIPAGTLEIVDFSESFRFIREHVHAFVDYRLKSPAGPFGGTWEETTGSLFDYFVLLEDNLVLEHSPEAAITTYSAHPNHYHVDVAPYSGKVRLPSIPPLGELTVYYDMYAFLRLNNEVLGKAFLGDPTDLSFPPAFSLVVPPNDPGHDPAVPEPAACLLVLAGLAGVARRRRTPRP